jgi:hypothetical protein
MKNNHFVLSLAFLAASISMFSCQKEAIVNPASEEYVVYEQTFVASERAANTASINWTADPGKFADVRFEVENTATNTVIYSYGWGYFNSASHTANYTIASGTPVRLRIKARKSVAGANFNINFSFSSTCPVLFPFGGTYNVTAPPGTAFSIIPHSAITTLGCL